MLTLSNGHQFTVATAAGALGFDGRGYSWEKYALIPLGVINPKLFTIITKTFTLMPRKGNMRWWRPCVWPFGLGGGAVNQMGLPNPGICWLVERHRRGLFPVPDLPTIVSITPETPGDAEAMAAMLDKMKDIKGIEINVSCPNVTDKYIQGRMPEDVRLACILDDKISHVRKLLRMVKSETDHPVGVKLGYTDPYREICEELDGEADWFDLINTIPWKTIFPDKKTPLRWQGLDAGGVSGPAIRASAWAALYDVTLDADRRPRPRRTPIISGGGVGDAEDGCARLRAGAAAVTIGTMFLTRPWRVNGIARGIIEGEKNAQRTPDASPTPPPPTLYTPG